MKGQKEPVLAVKELCVSFTMYDRGLNRREFEMVHQLSLTVNAGEIVAVAGSSGSGKACWPMGFLEFCRKMQK